MGGWSVVHVPDFILETISQIKLSDDQIVDQLKLPDEQRLLAFQARKITYPGKGFDAWWNLSQLIEQLKITIKVFDHTHPNCIAIFVFDRSSAYEGFVENALNINNMNINPGERQRKLQNSVIPLNNPDPTPGKEDTCGQIQHMCFPDDHPDQKLRGQSKGIKVVLQERKLIWDKFTAICQERGIKMVRKCASCTKSQTHKDAERRVALANIRKTSSVLKIVLK